MNYIRRKPQQHDLPDLACLMMVKQREDVNNPAIIVIGEVAGLRLEEIKPLQQKK